MKSVNSILKRCKKVKEITDIYALQKDKVYMVKINTNVVPMESVVQFVNELSKAVSSFRLKALYVVDGQLDISILSKDQLRDLKKLIDSYLEEK